MDNVNDGHFCRIREYLDSANTLLDTPHSFVIFCEPELESAFRSIRGDRPTVYMPIAFEDLPFWSLLPTIATNNARNPTIGVSPEKFTDLYYLIINHKMEFVRQAAALNPFATEWFAWIDVRAVLPSTGLHGLTQWWDPGYVNLFMMNLVDKKPGGDFFRYNRGWIAGGCFTGKRENILAFAEIAIREWKEALREGYCPSDEMVLAYMAAIYPDTVSPLATGDYGDLMRNQSAVCRKQDLAYYIQEFALARGDLRTSIRIGESLRRGYVAGVLPSMADHEHFHIFYRLALAYQRSTQPTLAAERTKELFRPEFDAMRAQFTPHLRPCAPDG
jgi:hypothetical protein